MTRQEMIPNSGCLSIFMAMAIGAALFGSCGKNISNVSNYESAYIQDVNRDGREDIVIQKSSDKKYPYINMGDGTYLSLDAYKERLQQFNIDSPVKTIEDCLKQDKN